MSEPKKPRIDITDDMVNRAMRSQREQIQICPVCDYPGMIDRQQVVDFLDDVLNGGD